MESLKATANRQVRAVVADDFPHMQEALVSCLQTVPGVEVVATALNGRDALDKIKQFTPCLAIIDLQMPIMDGFKLLREVRKGFPGMRLVAVSGHYSSAVVAEAISAGADVFVSKDELPHGLVNAVAKLVA
ncbi:MAG TPA: response regulator transcription factor [Terriglobales bacterium]|nr:response regulator transcription factor [Terriglobales bacterium]